MAKTSKNKMKAWRKEASYVNAKEGTKHNGRKMKAVRKQMEVFTPKFASMLVQNMLTSAGIVKVKTLETVEAKDQNEAV